MTRIDELLVQYIDGDLPAGQDDRVVVLHEPTGARFVIDFTTVVGLIDTLRYFAELHRIRSDQAQP